MVKEIKKMFLHLAGIFGYRDSASLLSIRPRWQPKEQEQEQEEHDDDDDDDDDGGGGGPPEFSPNRCS